MKKLLLLLIAASVSTAAFAQSIEKNEVDEFTGASVIRTSWERFTPLNKVYTYVSFSKLDDIYVFRLKVTLQKVFAVAEGEKVMFILEDGSVYKLHNLEHIISSTGGGAIGLGGSGAQGVSLSLISEDDPAFEKLKTELTKKIRVYTTDGYLEAEVNSKQAELLRNTIRLIE